MDYSNEIAAALTNDTVTAEVHKSTTQRGNRYRVYTFTKDGNMDNTLLVGIERNGNITDEYRNVHGKISQ